MREMLRQYIGKICQFKCLEGEVMGEILEISDDAILVKTYNTETNCIINLNYISKVIEVPLNKKGKPKAIY